MQPWIGVDKPHTEIKSAGFPSGEILIQRSTDTVDRLVLFPTNHAVGFGCPNSPQTSGIIGNKISLPPAVFKKESSDIG